MMKIKNIIPMLAAMGLLGACSSDDNEATGEGMVPINLTISPKAVSTRTATTDIQSTQLASGQTFYAYFTSSSVVPQSSVFTADGSGGATPASQPYFKLSGTTTDVRAYYPSTVTEATTSFVVEADQSTDASYRNSDLMYASATIPKVYPTSTAELAFAHKMAKVRVQTVNNGSNVKTITLKSVKRQVPFTASTGAVGAATASGSTDVTMFDHAGQTSDIDCVALIPPQTMTSGTTLIEVTTVLHSSSPLTYQLPANISFASGMQYIFTVNVHEERIIVSYSVSSWSATSSAGSAVNIIRPKLPIEYVAPYNMYNSTRMADNNYASKSAFFRWAAACSYFDGHVTISDYSGNTLSGRYHLPTVQEWMSIIGPRFSTATANNSAIDVDGADDIRLRFGENRTTRTGLGEKLQWGKRINNTWVMPSTKFYNEYTTNTSYKSTVSGVTRIHAYAIRLKDRDVAGPSGYGRYTCAYRYTYTDKDPSCNNKISLRIKVRYLGSYSVTVLDDITNDAYWNSSEMEYFELILPACGYSQTEADYSSPGSAVYYPERAYYWSNTTQDGTVTFQAFFSEVLCAGNHWNNKAMPTAIRLFKDAD